VRAKEKRRLDSWNAYVAEMRGQHTEEYLAGDMEGYRRGYTHGRQVEKQSKTDLTLAGALLLALSFAGAFIVGALAVGFLKYTPL